MARNPLYVSSEATPLPNSVHRYTNLYAFGAVGYLKVIGHNAFEVRGMVESLQLQISEPHAPPSRRSGRTVPPELEYAILPCLKTKPDKANAKARDMAKLLDACPYAGE